MRVLVTGGNGRIGRAAALAFAGEGHEVRSLDLALPAERIPGVRHRVGSVADMGDVAGAMMGWAPDAAVHMAAWTNSGIASEARTYGENAAGAFNVATAAAEMGARRIVLGSSAQVYGFEALDPVRVPVDEDHPLRPLNAYALSKIAAERAGAYVAGRTGAAVVSLRIMGARTAEQMPGEIEALRAAPEGGRFLLWTRVDVRDVAEACVGAATTPDVPSGAYNVTGARILLDAPTREVLARHCPGLDLVAAPEGSASPMSCARAAAAFGYAPRHPVLP